MCAEWACASGNKTKCLGYVNKVYSNLEVGSSLWSGRQVELWELRQDHDRAGCSRLLQCHCPCLHSATTYLWKMRIRSNCMIRAPAPSAALISSRNEMRILCLRIGQFLKIEAEGYDHWCAKSIYLIGNGHSVSLLVVIFWRFFLSIIMALRGGRQHLSLVL